LGTFVKGDFQVQLQEALRRRLYPNGPLHLKEVAAAIGRADNTVTRWWRGETCVTGSDLYQLAQFFAQRGDSGFLRDIFGALLSHGGSASPMAVALARAVLIEAGDSHAPVAPRDAWIKADGQMTPTVLDHIGRLCTELKLPRHHGDPIGYAIRVLGWVAVSENSDGTVAVRHSSRRVSPLAAERACDWLEDNADQIREVERLVLTGTEWVQAVHHAAGAAAKAIADTVFLMRLPRREWKTNRLSLDAVQEPLLRKLLRAYHEASDQVIHAAAKMGAFTTSNVYGIDGDDVICHHIGTSLGFDARVEGMNVLARADTEYALALHDRVLRTNREGPAYYELTGMIDDRYARYLNLTLPAGSAPARVLTSSVVLEVERLVA
jgi:hypothetical protein